MTAKPLLTPAERIRAARQSAGLTQRELAERAGMSSQQLSHYETGLTEPTLANLRRIAAALEIEPGSLI